MFSSYVCAGDASHGIMTSSLIKELLAFHLSQISGDKNIDHKTKLILFVVPDKGSQD